ncbi:hypothetical protein ACFQGT_00255 [Natrialbaceae archaeon GCM10025810]
MTPTTLLDEDGRADGRKLAGGPRLPLKPREFMCEKCDRRCTRGTEGLEYGHQYGCPNRPDSLPTGDRSEYERYKREVSR